MIKNYILITVLSLLMVGAFGYGIFRSGSPFETRDRKFDEQRVSDISSLSYNIEGYYQDEGILPETLADIPKESLYGQGINDPETEKQYEYQIINDTNYKLCADFSTDSSQDPAKQNSYTYYESDSEFEHPKGSHCFELNTDGVVLNPWGVSSPPIQKVQSADSTNTTELAKQARDAARLSDLSNLQNAINVAVQEATDSSSAILCSSGLSTSSVCTGNSLINGRTSSGDGWIKANLSNQRSVSIPTLPVDPMNNGLFHYTYCSDGEGWEINAALESSQQQPKMSTDGGDDNSVYEVGSDLTTIGNSGKCKY